MTYKFASIKRGTKSNGETYYNDLFKSLEIDATYNAFYVENEVEFKARLDKLISKGYIGISIGSPYKYIPITYLKAKITTPVLESNICNTITIDSNKIITLHNTDIYGLANFTTSIENFHTTYNAEYKRTLIIGSGALSRTYSASTHVSHILRDIVKLYLSTSLVSFIPARWYIVNNINHIAPLVHDTKTTSLAIVNLSGKKIDHDYPGIPFLYLDSSDPKYGATNFYHSQFSKQAQIYLDHICKLQEQSSVI